MDPYLGEIRILATPLIPRDWHVCDGSLLSITGNEALYTLLGTVYGGDGRTTFGIPDLRGRVVVNTGQGTGLSTYTLGVVGGSESIALTGSNLPQHTHSFVATSANATSPTPSSSLIGAKQDVNNPGNNVYSFIPGGLAGQTTVTLNNTSVSTEGQGAAHENRMSYLSINYVICLVGLFPNSN
jgi:microcystin-dependent protein